MLAETYRLYEALDRAGIKQEARHPRVKTPGATSGPCLRVRLDAEGTVAAVESVTEEEWPGLWTIMEGFHNSFPVVRVKESLIRPSGDASLWTDLDAAAKSPTTVAQVLEEALSQAPDTLARKHLRLWQRLREKKASELLTVASGTSEEDRLLRALAARFSLAAKEPARLLRGIATVGIQVLRQGILSSSEALQLLLVGKQSPPGARKAPPFTVQLAFDIVEHDLPGRLYSKVVEERLVEALPLEIGSTEKRRSEQVHPAQSCAFTGTRESLQTAPFPKVKLPVLNKDFPLFSMFSDARCNYRYGLTDSAVVPVTKTLVQQLHEALSHIVASSREGKTWQAVASGSLEKRGGRASDKLDLLVAYVDGAPNIPERVAAIFGAGRGSSEKQFEVDAQVVCRALHGLVQARPASRLNLFILRKASEGQAQVVLAESPTVDEVLSAAERWQEGPKNLPEIRVPVLSKGKGERPRQLGPTAPYPDDVVRLLSENWVAGGGRSASDRGRKREMRVIRLPGPGLGEVLTVMLRKPGYSQTSRKLLGLTLSLAGRLLLSLTAALHSGERSRQSGYGSRERLQTLRAVSVIGILLSTLERRKETYMKGPAFMVGQVLSRADTLHREYCKKERGNDLPPQLIGNALVPVASDRLDLALARLSQRLIVYRGWADARGTGLARWAVHSMGTLCSRLADLDLSQPLDEPAKAELLLGYMARTDKSDTAAETVQSDSDEEETVDVHSNE